MTTTDSTTSAPHTATTILEVDDLAVTYGGRGNRVEAIGKIDLKVRKDEFICIVGPSGCGKTTLLKAIAGLLPPSRGRSRLHGNVITRPPAGLAVVFQDYGRSLFPWMSVRQNVALALRRGEQGRAAARKTVTDSVAAVGLSDFIDHYPWQLSGGMQQRVAIARALACKPEILLLDEPFASVDALVRSELEDLVLDVCAGYGVTALLVTHDIDEAVYMADRVVVLTKAPATSVRKEIVVDLPRPRNQLTTKTRAEFATHRAEIYQMIVDESPAAR